MLSPPACKACSFENLFQGHWVKEELPHFTLEPPKSDQHLISPYCKTAQLNIKVIRIKKKIANLRSFDC